MNNYEQNNNEFNNNNNQMNNMNNMNPYPNNNGQYYNMNNGYNNNGFNNMNNGYNNMPNDKKPLSHYIKKFLVAFLFAALLIFILLWLFPTKSALNPFYDRIFQENLDTMKEVATAYYTTDRLPKKEGDTKKLTLGEMLEMKLLLDVKDKNGETCDLDDSYVELTRQEKEYKMKVNLKCGEEEDYIVVYLGCYNYCLNDICEKKKTENKVVAVIQKTTNSIVKKIEKATNTVIIKKPEKKQYKYLYKKVVTIHHKKEYSNWTGWSKNIKYDPNNNNINWGTHEYIINEKVGHKLITTYEVDKTKPVWQQKVLETGTYRQYGCAEYEYFYDETTQTTYRTNSGGWIDQGVSVYSKVPDSTSTVKYVFAGVSYSDCGTICDSSPKYKFRKFVRSASQTNTTSTIKADVEVYCKTTVVKDIPKSVIVNNIAGYGVKKVQTKIYYYHYKERETKKEAYTKTKPYKVWSYSKNDKSLIKQGYKYTGIYKRIK